MIERPTVLVLGAGASQPFGFPLGGELMDRIKSGLATGGAFATDLHVCGFRPRAQEDFRRILDKNPLYSIDSILEKRQEFVEIGKACIARALIPLERAAALTTGDWYQYLFNRLATTTPDEFQHNRLSIVTFNYDRSFEQYIFDAVANVYGIGEERAASTIRGIRVVHVHGALTEHPAYCPGGRRYDADVDHEQLLASARQIRIVHEAEDPVFEEARQMLRAADLVAFLGFGFHPESMRRIFAFGEHTRVCGSAYKLAGSDSERTRNFCAKRGHSIKLGLAERTTLEYLKEELSLE